MEKSSMIMFINGLNFHLWSHLTCCFKSTYVEELQNLPPPSPSPTLERDFLNEMFSKMPLF